VRAQNSLSPAALLLVLIFWMAWVLPVYSGGVFLKLAGVPGESVDEKHPGAIEIESWSWGVSKAGGTAAAGWTDLSLTTRSGKSTPKLMEAVCKATVQSNAVFTISNQAAKDFYRVELSGVRVTSWTGSGSGGSEDIGETVTLSFEKIRLDYVLFSSEGAARHNSWAEWDRLRNSGAGDSKDLVLTASLSFVQGARTGVLIWNGTPGKTYRVLAASDPTGPFYEHGTYEPGENTVIEAEVPFDRTRLFFKIEEL
jgi:type VI secretion system secreted protein Hcp